MIKIYGIAEQLNPIKAKISETINQCMVTALSFPDNKRAHRFFPMTAEDFYYPEGRTNAYTVIEISMITGRSVEAKKNLIMLLFTSLEQAVGLNSIDIEIQIIESPAHDWGFRGMTGDTAKLKL